MSEFYFDYKCIAMSDQINGASSGISDDKQLDFYLFQDYDTNKANMCVQVRIPEEMQKNCVGVRVYFKSQAVEFPKLSDLEYSEFIPCDDGGGRELNRYCIKDGNCVFIRGLNNELSGTGLIAFIRGNNRNAIPQIEDTYKFVINYAKKETISYRIIEQKNGIKVQIIYPLLRSNIDLNIVKKEKAKPISRYDYKKTNLIMNESKDNPEPIKITLEKNGRIEDVKKKRIKLNGIDTSSVDFRLTFADKTNNKYYLLSDESDYTLEDHKERKINKINRYKRKTKIHKCPYCGKEIKEISKYKKGSTCICTCQGDVLDLSGYTIDDKLRKQKIIVCNNFKNTNLGQEVENFIPVDNLIIPNKYLKLPSMNIVTIGQSRSGKTIFLSSLFNMMRDPYNGVYSSPFLLNRIVDAFDKTTKKKEKLAEELKWLNVEFGKDKKVKLGDNFEKKRCSSYETIKSRYIISTGGLVEAQTLPSEAPKLSWQPVGFQLNNLGYIYFYDVPGEIFNEENDLTLRTFDMADCFLAIIDGGDNSEKAVRDLKFIIERVQTMTEGKKIDLKQIPIAIVFTKHDLKLEDYIPENDQLRRDSCFDENCHVVREDILDMLPRDGIYAGSELERHIDCSSYELEHYLKSFNSDDVNDIKSKCKNIKFFTCSSLGTSKCLSEDLKEQKKEVLFTPRRLRMELPIIWLMYQKGLIKR